jgi:hypothetical protein
LGDECITLNSKELLLLAFSFSPDPPSSPIYYKMALDPKTTETRKWLGKYWSSDLDWTLLPQILQKVWTVPSTCVGTTICILFILYCKFHDNHILVSLVKAKQFSLAPILRYCDGIVHELCVPCLLWWPFAYCRAALRQSTLHPTYCRSRRASDSHKL